MVVRYQVAGLIFHCDSYCLQYVAIVCQLQCQAGILLKEHDRGTLCIDFACSAKGIDEVNLAEANGFISRERSSEKIELSRAKQGKTDCISIRADL